MRIFAGDHFARLAVQHGDLLRPWVMPSWAPRPHRDRLAALLAQALRALDPGLTLIQLRWAERHALKAGRILLPSSTLVWWRVHAVPVFAPESVVLDGSSFTPGLPLFDFDAEARLPAEAWLGPLKMRTLHQILDRLLDERPVAAHEEIADALGELSARLVSPIDLVTAAEAMVEASAEGARLSAAKAEAVGRVIAGRFVSGSADDPIKALVAVGRGQTLEGDLPAMLRKAGLADEGGPTLLLEMVRDEETLRRAVLRTMEHVELKGALSELAPGLMPETSAEAPVRTAVEILSAGVLSAVSKPVKKSPPPSEPVVREAWELAQRGAHEDAARALMRAIQQDQSAGWADADKAAAGDILARAATQHPAELGWRQDSQALDHITALWSAAFTLFEQSGSYAQAAYAARGEGSAMLRQGRWQEALDAYERGAKWAARAQDTFALALYKEALATVNWVLDRTPEALADARQAASMYQALRRQEDEARAQTLVGDAHMALGQIDEARAAYDRAQTALGPKGDPRPRANLLISLSDLHKKTNDLHAARRALEEALAIEHKLAFQNALIHQKLGFLSLDRNEPMRACEEFQAAATAYHNLGDKRSEARLLLQLGDTRRDMKNWASAEEAYAAALTLARELDDKDLEAEALEHLREPTP